MKPLLLIAVLSLAAASASAGTTDPAVEPKTFDFTKRPEIVPLPLLSKHSAPGKLSVDEARALSQALSATFQNLSGLSTFRYYTRGEGQVPMSAEDRAWADEELAKASTIAGNLDKAAQEALKEGIERRVNPPGYHLGRLKRPLLGSFAYMVPKHPTLNDLMREHYRPMGEIQYALSILIHEATEDPQDTDPASIAEVEKYLAENRAKLADSDAKIKAFEKENAEKAAVNDSSVKDAVGRAKRVTDGAGSFEAPKSPEGAPGVTSGAGGGISAEEAAKRANAVPTVAPLKKRKPVPIPAP